MNSLSWLKGLVTAEAGAAWMHVPLVGCAV
jgi:hypothetical protein